MSSSASDVVVVGAGSGGCALAARLAASGAEVELIEAGPAVKVGRDASDCDLSGRLDWRYQAQITAGRRSDVPRGRVVGGTSVINTCVAMRPDPDSFAAWQGVAPGWGWRDVLPYFKRLERETNFPAPEYHGDAGPVPVVRWREDELEPASRAFRDAARESGIPTASDLNAPGATGVGMVPMNREGRRRISADRAYLTPPAARPPRVAEGRLVDRVLFRRRRAVGVVSFGSAGECRHLADQVVLCAGAYGSPAILLRSGIGPERELRNLGLEVVAELHGVGRGLCDHSQVHLPALAPAAAAERPALQVLVRTTTPGSAVRNDIQLCVLNRVDLQRYAPEVAAGGRSLAMLCVLLQHACSRGKVWLASTRPDAEPRIEIDYVAEPEDRARYRDGLRLLAAIAAQSELASFPLLEGLPVDTLDSGGLDGFVANKVKTAHHPMGTAQMGHASDPHSVVGADLSVHGVEGLSVADASVVPVSLNANIHLACTMIGERAADILA